MSRIGRHPSLHSSIFNFYFSLLWPLLPPLLLLLPGLTSFPYPSAEAPFSDMVLAHYPNAIYLRQSLLYEHHLPFWSPAILSGFPFAANPLSGLWYPPGWLALFFPLPFGFNLLVMAHMLWGGVGMYVLLRTEGLSRRAAILGAVGFEAMPKLFAHYGAGHLTLLYAVTWTPWLLCASRQTLTVFKRRFPWIEAVILAMIFLADVRWTVYAALLWAGYVLVHLRRSKFPPVRLSLGGRFAHLGTQTLLAVLIAAPLALPLAEFVRLSSRALMVAEDFFAYSLPVPRLLGLVFPDFGGFHEWMLYSGLIALMLSLLACFWVSARPASKFWIWAAVLALLFSIGSQLPPLRLLASLPVINLLRVPSRALFVLGMALAALAAYATERLMGSSAPREKRVGALCLAGLTSFILVLSAGVWLISGRLPLSFAWASGLALLGALWIGLRFRQRLSPRIWWIGLMILCLADWVWMDHTLFYSRPAKAVFSEGQALADYLSAVEGEYRLYSPSYSLPQQTAANDHLQLADGVDPMQLQSYVSFMQAATGVPWTGYSVAVPPYSSGQPQSDNASYRPDPVLLGLLNVRFVASEFDLPVEGLALLSRFGETRLYENQMALPRAWVQPEDTPVGDQIRPVERLSWEPSHIDMAAEGPGLLVLSEVDYPGWRVWVDGQPAAIVQVADLLRGVHLSPGEHQILFTFQPVSLYIGGLLCALAISFLALSWRRSLQVGTPAEPESFTPELVKTGDQFDL